MERLMVAVLATPIRVSVIHHVQSELGLFRGRAEWLPPGRIRGPSGRTKTLELPYFSPVYYLVIIIMII